MLKQALSVLVIVATGTSMALGQGAGAAGSAQRLPTQSYAEANGYAPPVAQSVPASPYGNNQPGAQAATVAAPTSACTTGCDPWAKSCMDGWFDIDYLMLFPSRTKVPTMFNDTTGAPAAGNSPDLGISNGLRFDAGMWLREQIGVQAIGMFTFRSYVNSTTAAGTIPLAPGPVAATNFQYQTWHYDAGGEANTFYRLIDDGKTKLYAIAGFRYLNMEEDLTAHYIIGGTNFFDDFHTRDQFAGLQLGAKAAHSFGRLDIDGTAKVALGVNYDQLFVLGSNYTVVGGVITPGAAPVQAFTQASNIGSYGTDFFSVLPEVDVNARYKLTERLTINVGYMFLMSINNWRPGEQVSLNFPPTISPPTRSTYYLHGFTAGMTFTY